MTGDIAPRSHLMVTERFHPATHRHALVRAVLAEQPTAGGEGAPAPGDNFGKGLKTRWPADQCASRLVAQGLQMGVVRGHIGWIGDDQIEAKVGQRAIPVTGDQHHISHSQAFAVDLGDGQSRR